jgi:hypothetical protein
VETGSSAAVAVDAIDALASASDASSAATVARPSLADSCVALKGIDEFCPAFPIGCESTRAIASVS